MGGLHTATAIQQLVSIIEEGDCTNPNLKEVPQGWLQWPCKPYFFPKPLEDYWRPLLALGNIDNEAIQLEVSWYSKVLKCRELFLIRFGTYTQYRADLEEAKKPTGAVKRQLIAQWCKGVQFALVLRESQFGHVRQIVATEEETWNLYDRLLRREYKQFERKPARSVSSTKRTAGAPLRKEGYEPMGSPNELFPFLGLPFQLLNNLFLAVLDGSILFKAAQKQANEYRALIKLGRDFEKRFNALAGVTKNKARAIKQGKWFTMSEVRSKVPDVSRQAQTWLPSFAQKREEMTARESEAFRSLWRPLTRRI